MEQQRRGKLPEIQTHEGSVTFSMVVALQGGASGALVLRCDAEGEIYVSLRESE